MRIISAKGQISVQYNNKLYRWVIVSPVQLNNEMQMYWGNKIHCSRQPGEGSDIILMLLWFVKIYERNPKNVNCNFFRLRS